MLENLVFCFNATLPVFLLMLIGMAMVKFHVIDEVFVTKMNSFVFRVALPVLVFYDLCKEDFYDIWDGKYLLYCFLVTLAEILLTVGLSYLLKNKDIQGEFIQAAYRSSAAILGVSLVENLYGNSGMVPLMMLGAVPLYNVAAVAVLELYSPEKKDKRSNRRWLRQTAVGVVTNPIILGIFAGLLWAVLRIPMPTILDHTVENIARTASPLGILAMGASFDIHKALSAAKEAVWATSLKLVLLGMAFLPIGILLGFRGAKLVAITIMCCSPTTVSSFVMAKAMGHEGSLTASTVMLTTLLSAVTLTLWLFVFRSLGYL